MEHTERACCDDIVDVKGRVSSLESWKAEYIESAQKWRDSHEKKNSDSNDRIFAKLDSIESKMLTFVNPIVATIITLLAAAVAWFAAS